MINWKARLKNPAFWISVVIAVITPVLAYMGITAKDITTWGALWDVITGAAANPYILLMAAVSVYNAVIDPTTPGFSDAEKKGGEENGKL